MTQLNVAPRSLRISMGAPTSLEDGNNDTRGRADKSNPIVFVSPVSASAAAGLLTMLRRLTAFEIWDGTQASRDQAPILGEARADIQRPSGGVAPGALRRVREHVEARLSERICLRELAAIAGLSDCHFSRAFKQSVGVPPHRYIMTRRIAAAVRLLQDSDRPLTEISHAVGFCDHSHFTRVFVDVMGETPRGFRWRHR